MAQTTRDTARSRLFGTTPAARPDPAGPETTRREASSSSAGKGRDVAAGTPSAASTAPKQAASRQDGQSSKGSTNYLGSGRYLYKGREARKLSVYVSPELVPALKAAGASGKDPRGNDMSEIVETLIREAGYGRD